MKKVHSSQQLFHLFCNMTNSNLEGFKTPSRNVYFENGILFSYGPHYPMARKLSVGEGLDHREIILINSNKSTVTTQKHKSQIRSSAKPNQLVLHVPDISDPKNIENSTYLMNEICESISEILRGLKYSSVDAVTRSINKYNQYAKTFRLKQFSLDTDLYTTLAILSRDNEAKNETKLQEKHAKREIEQAENKAKWAKEVELWYSCQNATNIPSRYFGLSFDPIRVNGEIVESPRGVHVSLNEAKAFCNMLKNGEIEIGMKISEFEVLSINSKTVEIGCHKINIKQALEAVLGM